MKYKEIFLFEIGYQLRRAWLWLVVAVIMVLVFIFMRDGSFSEALYTEFFINGPFMVAMATVFGSLLWLLMAAFVAGEAASRDISTGMHPFVYTTPISKVTYLGGRFAAALVINLLILATVQVSIILAVYLPGVHPDSIGPFRTQALITAYFFISVPSAFAATALQFFLASKSGRPMAANLGSLMLFFTAFFIASLILFRKSYGTLIDPIGVRFIWDELSHLWTNVEKSHRLLTLEGTLLHNRLMWIATGILCLIVTYWQFAFNHREAMTIQSLIKKLHRKNIISEVSQAQAYWQPVTINYQRNFGLLFQMRIVWTTAWSSFRAIASSLPGLAMLIVIPMFAIPVVIDQMLALGIPMVPSTGRVISELTGPLSADVSRWMIIPGFIIFFTGELLWRERDNHLAEISDAMPGSDWSAVLGRLLGIIFMLLLFTVMLTCAGITAQLIMNFQPENWQDEITLYFKIMFGLQLPEYMLFAVLALVVHTIVNQKYVGHLAAITAYAFIAAIATMLGIEHNMLIFGAGPNWSYTEMLGFGSTIIPWLWFKAYWAAWALLLLVVTVLFWTRGKETQLSIRIKMLKSRFTTRTKTTTIIASVIIICIGTYIFYNTNILNAFRTSQAIEEWKAEYERRYGKFDNKAQPDLVSAKLQVEIYPEERTTDIRGTYYLVNTTEEPIDSIHISTSTGGTTTKDISFGKESTLVVDDETHHYRIYKLKSPLSPEDSIALSFHVTYHQQGFRNNGIDPSLNQAGSYFSNTSWFPSVGYQRQRGLINPVQRRNYGLSPRPVLASLHEAHNGEAVTVGGGIQLEVIVGTSEGQQAVTPGELRRTWTDSTTHRRYFHFVTSAPIGNEWSFFSAPYEVYEKTWTPSSVRSDSIHAKKPVSVRIYHHPKHKAHLDRMMEAVHASLGFYSKEFGVYRYNHLTVVEHPAAPGTGMHADPSLIYYGQGYAHWFPETQHSLDLPYAIMGHEMGHQWTLPYAFVEGLPFLSEGLAWHYSIMMVQATRDSGQLRQLMSFMRQPYPHQPIRRGEPLLRALDPYLAYKRGPLAMYALTQYAGADRVNKALHTLNTNSRLPLAKPVSTLDLYAELKNALPDSLQPLLYDIFEVNTLWSFETKGVTSIKKNNLWEVTLRVTAKKIVYDSAGVETEVPMNEWIPIGVFGKRKPGHDELSSPLFLKPHRIRSGEQTITVTVAGPPLLAGIDPHHLLDWEEKEDDDNIEAVMIEQ